MAARDDIVAALMAQGGLSPAQQQYFAGGGALPTSIQTAGGGYQRVSDGGGGGMAAPQLPPPMSQSTMQMAAPVPAVQPTSGMQPGSFAGGGGGMTPAQLTYLAQHGLDPNGPLPFRVQRSGGYYDPVRFPGDGGDSGGIGGGIGGGGIGGSGVSSDGQQQGGQQQQGGRDQSERDQSGREAGVPLPPDDPRGEGRNADFQNAMQQSLQFTGGREFSTNPYDALAPAGYNPGNNPFDLFGNAQPVGTASPLGSPPMGTFQGNNYGNNPFAAYNSANPAQLADLGAFSFGPQGGPQSALDSPFFGNDPAGPSLSNLDPNTQEQLGPAENAYGSGVFDAGYGPGGYGDPTGSLSAADLAAEEAAAFGDFGDAPPAGSDEPDDDDDDDDDDT